jgi:transposase InsO family protein
LRDIRADQPPLARPSVTRVQARRVEFATLEWADWFNNRHLIEPIGNIPPAEAEARYYAIQQEIALAA